MKYLLSILCILLLVGCSAPAEQAEVVEPTEPAPEAVEEPEPAKEPTGVVEEEAIVVGTDNIQKLEDLIKINDYARIYPSNTKANVGDSYIFAHGITNPSLSTINMQQEIQFVEAIDSYSNPFQNVDLETMKNWIDSTHFVIFEVGSNKMVVREIQITVGNEIAPGVPTPKGTYKFKASLSDADKEAAGDPDIYRISDFSVRVN